MTNRPILLVGCGQMAIDYAKVLSALGVPFVAIGRGSKSCAAFATATGITPMSGGIEEASRKGVIRHELGIVAVPIDKLAAVTQQLIKAGVSRVLVEKPGGLNTTEIAATARLATRRKAQVFVAYNRRFYASTRTAREMILADGGLSSFCFEFTEWPHEIAHLPLSPAIKQEWFLANSSHVCDLAFFLGGIPIDLKTYIKGALDWHRAGAQFTGCGVSRTGALFSYHSNWNSAGRWGLELCTEKRRLIFRPLEKLQQQLRGQLTISEIPLDDLLDRQFKPGVNMQTRAFLNDDCEDSDLLKIADQATLASKIYRRMSPPPEGSKNG